MTRYIPAGSILPWRQDPNPSNGDHLDVRINRRYGDRGHVNPLTKPGLLSRLRFGPNQGKGLSDFPITSGYGPRNLDIPGSSKYHKGIDYGIASGTPIFWSGDGQYKPEGTLGVIYTNDEKGNPYEILLTHTQLGNAHGQTVIAPATNDQGKTMPTTPEGLESEYADEIALIESRGQAKAKAEQWRARTAADVVEGFGNNYGEMESQDLANHLKSVQESIIQQRMDGGESFGMMKVTDS